jgi:probable F420-dependent oxidoreductase
MAIKVGVNILGLQGLIGGTVRDVLDVAVAADRKGVDVLTLGDHLGFQRSAHQARRETHAFPFVLEEPWPEPITFLSAAAALTSRIRLSTFVLIAPLRPTLLLAKQLATLDNISNGRVTMGLGVGWQVEEFAAAGMEFEGRFGDLEDMVAAMRALWSEPPATAKGRHFHFEDFYSLPRPVQGADLPLLFGIKPSPRNIDRMARLSDGWALNPADRKEFVATVAEIKRLATSYGRDPEAFQFDVGQGPSLTQEGVLDTETIRRRVRKDEADGATIVSFLARDFCKTRDDIEPFLDFIVSLKE